MTADSPRGGETQRFGGYASVVDSTTRLTPEVVAIRLERPLGFAFRASQFVRLVVPTPWGPDWRPMSIASAPTREYVEFAARISNSPFKQGFADLQPGDEVALHGPRGHFLIDTEWPAVMVAGGIGITPLKSMIDYVTDMNLDTPIKLVYGNSTPSEIAYRDELDKTAADSESITVMHTVTRPDASWTGRTGRIDVELLRQAASGHDRPLYYLAGPPSMVVDSFRDLTALGVPQESIDYEVFRGYR